MDDNDGLAPYTIILQTEIDGYDGYFLVCVEGHHNVEDLTIMGRKLFALHMDTEGALEEIDNKDLRDDLLYHTALFYLVVESDAMTTEAQPFCTDTEGHESWFVTIPELGSFELTCLGVVEVEDDTYELFSFQLVDGSPAILILEVIGTNPLEYRGIREDADLFDQVIQAFVMDIGIDLGEEDEADTDDTVVAAGWGFPIGDA